MHPAETEKTMLDCPVPNDDSECSFEYYVLIISTFVRLAVEK